MGIFDRLSRLARAEANHWGHRARHAWDERSAEPLLGGEEDVEPLVDEDVRRAPEPPPRRPTYPPEVREAYAVLEIPLGSDRETVRAAYRRQLRVHHPDRHAHHGDEARERRAHERTMRIREAWERLDDWLE
ncbi:MAG: J domain-containing protein [Myxococcota bacterium]